MNRFSKKSKTMCHRRRVNPLFFFLDPRQPIRRDGLHVGRRDAQLVEQANFRIVDRNFRTTTPRFGTTRQWCKKATLRPERS